MAEVTNWRFTVRRCEECGKVFKPIRENHWYCDIRCFDKQYAKVSAVKRKRERASEIKMEETRQNLAYIQANFSRIQIEVATRLYEIQIVR